MSTKTTLKRVAAVAAAALAISGFSAVSAHATTTTVTPVASTGFSLNASSITVVASDATIQNNYGVFELSLANGDGYSAPLQAGESLTATVVSAPTTTGGTAPVKGNLSLGWTTTASNFNKGTGANSTDVHTSAVTTSTINSSATSAWFDSNLSTNKRSGANTSGASLGWTTVDSTYGNDVATYALKVGAESANGFDAGAYTIRIDLLDSNSNAIKSTTVKFTLASSKITSGAVLTAASTGLKAPGAALYVSSTNKVKATITDANGGLVREAGNTAPSLSAVLKDAATTPVVATTGSITASDDGATGADAAASALDGVYSLGGTIVSAPTAGSGTLTVTYGATTATATVALSGDSSGKYGSTTVSAAGGVAASGNYTLPLTTKSIKNTITVVDNATLAGANPVTGSAVYYTISYSGCVTGDLSPVAAAGVKVLTDANGQASVTITNANAADGCAATVTWSGVGASTTPAGYLSRTFTWAKPVATTVAASTGSVTAKVLSSNSVTWTILDQFSAPMAGQSVTLGMTGANAPTTATLPSQISDANGQVKYSWTDAAAVPASTTLGFDTVRVASVGTTTISATTNNNVTFTYKATLPVVASLYATYGASGTVVPTTSNIGGSTGIAISTADQYDLTKSLAGSTGTSAPWVKLNFTAKDATPAAVSGVPTTVTVTGAKLVGVDGKLASSTIVYANDDVYVLGTTAGVATVTATNGSISSTATILFVNAADDARVLTLADSNGTLTATVTDAFGNAVSGATVEINAVGGRLSSGSSFGSFTTATDGTVVVDIIGSATVTAKIAATTSAKYKYLAGFADATGVTATTGAPAGVRSATVTTGGVADGSQAALDAAQEATDAANAAYDAANNAMDSADAATAAAQDASDNAAAALAAVTSLSATVAKLVKSVAAIAAALAKVQKKIGA